MMGGSGLYRDLQRKFSNGSQAITLESDSVLIYSGVYGK